MGARMPPAWTTTCASRQGGGREWAKSSFKTVIYDDGHEARELTANEERLLVNVARKLGHEAETIEG